MFKWVCVWAGLALVALYPIIQGMMKPAAVVSLRYFWLTQTTDHQILLCVYEEQTDGQHNLGCDVTNHTIGDSREDYKNE